MLKATAEISAKQC